MTVYVDDMRAPFGRMVMCHMWADTREELFAMADRIGVARRWFQRPPAVGGPGMDASWEHFDIALGKRALAVRFGAVETDRYGPLEHEARRKGNQAKLDQIERLRAERSPARPGAMVHITPAGLRALADAAEAGKVRLAPDLEAMRRERRHD